jgi:hypothetical protein
LLLDLKVTDLAISLRSEVGGRRSERNFEKQALPRSDLRPPASDLRLSQSSPNFLDISCLIPTSFCHFFTFGSGGTMIDKSLESHRSGIKKEKFILWEK